MPDNYNNGEELDYWLFATDSNFNTLWSKNFGGSDPCGDLACGSFNGNILLKDNMLYAFIKNTIPDSFPDFDIECGYERNFYFETDAWLVAFDLNTVSIESSLHVYEDITIYPNPATNELYIDLTAITETQIPVRIIIYNLIGNKILEQELFAGEIQTIALNNFSAGIYLLQCYQENILLHTEKVMVE
ncbi:MAG: T9SS type A sorting domain-containing protein [Bacteroidetes bacterium]|nr:T9SS type A sorting domain-containing protein [Bacteroidota bacterium]